MIRARSQRENVQLRSRNSAPPFFLIHRLLKKTWTQFLRPKKLFLVDLELPTSIPRMEYSNVHLCREQNMIFNQAPTLRCMTL